MVKKIILAIVLIIIIGVIAGIAFFYTQKNNNGLIDIYNKNNNNYNIEILKSSPEIIVSEKFKAPNWLPKGGNGIRMTFSPKFIWQTGEIVFRAKGAGEVEIDLMGAYRQIPNSRNLEKVYVEYKDVTLNDKTLFKNVRALWHNNRYTLNFPAKDNYVYTLKFDYKNPS